MTTRGSQRRVRKICLDPVELAQVPRTALLASDNEGGKGGQGLFPSDGYHRSSALVRDDAVNAPVRGRLLGKIFTQSARKGSYN